MATTDGQATGETPVLTNSANIGLPIPGAPPTAPEPTETTPEDTTPEVQATEEEWDPDRARALIAKLRQEAKAATKAIKERDQLQAQVKAHEDEKLSEQDRLTKRAADLEAQLANEQRASRDRDNRYQVQLLAGRMNLVDPEAAEKLLPWDDVDFDDAGRPTNLEDVLKDLVKARPYLQGQAPPEARQTSSPTNGASRAASTGAREYTAAELADYGFYQANRDDIILAMREGRIRG